jgi:hypothetical protein
MGFRASKFLLRAGAVVLSVGLLLFVFRAPQLETQLPKRLDHPTSRHNLVAAAYGPSIRASSYHHDVYDQHHPAFLVDRRTQPSTVEKWASRPKDKSPWIELRWHGVHTVESVVLVHAGAFEPTDLTVHKYEIICLRAQGNEVKRVTVQNNVDSTATHTLNCTNAIGVRLELTPNWPGDIVRLYEVEAWGQ